MLIEDGDDSVFLGQHITSLSNQNSSWGLESGSIGSNGANGANGAINSSFMCAPTTVAVPTQVNLLFPKEKKFIFLKYRPPLFYIHSMTNF